MKVFRVVLAVGLLVCLGASITSAAAQEIPTIIETVDRAVPGDIPPPLLIPLVDWSVPADIPPVVTTP
jgi:hypothetical protein